MERQNGRPVAARHDTYLDRRGGTERQGQEKIDSCELL